MRATICLPRELIREPMMDLDPEGLPRARLRGTRRVTTTPMTTTVTTDLNEADLVGRRLRYAVGVGGAGAASRATWTRPGDLMYGCSIN